MAVTPLTDVRTSVSRLARKPSFTRSLRRCADSGTVLPASAGATAWPLRRRRIMATGKMRRRSTAAARNAPATRPRVLRLVSFAETSAAFMASRIAVSRGWMRVLLWRASCCHALRTAGASALVLAERATASSAKVAISSASGLPSSAPSQIDRTGAGMTALALAMRLTMEAGFSPSAAAMAGPPARKAAWESV